MNDAFLRLYLFICPIFSFRDQLSIGRCSTGDQLFSCMVLQTKSEMVLRMINKCK